MISERVYCDESLQKVHFCNIHCSLSLWSIYARWCCKETQDFKDEAMHGALKTITEILPVSPAFRVLQLRLPERHPAAPVAFS